MSQLDQTNQMTEDGFEVTLRQDDSGPLIIITSTFFMWGFITVMNGLLIDKLKSIFDLSTAQTQVIDFAFFAAYFIVGFATFLISRYWFDPTLRFGYKRLLIVGVIITGTGCGLFYPAAAMEGYYMFLLALFILASGIAILQIVANPYVCLLGKTRNTVSRINLAQAFNSLGTALAPMVGTYIILSSQNNTDSLRGPYITLSFVLFMLAILISFARMRDDFFAPKRKSAKIQKNILEHPHLTLGVIAIFLYVGAEVSIHRHLSDFLMNPDIAGLTLQEAEVISSLYWGGAMAGRFFGATFMANLKEQQRITVSIILLILSYILGILTTGDDITAWIFTSLVAINLFVASSSHSRPGKTLGTYAIAAIILIIFGMITTGEFAMWSIISIGLFNSIMFPTIFALALRELRTLTTQGSALLIMAICGGAVIPVVQSVFVNWISIQFSYVIPALCYIFIAYYGFKGSRIGRTLSTGISEFNS